MPYFTLSGNLEKSEVEELKEKIRDCIRGDSDDDPFYDEPYVAAGKIAIYVEDRDMNDSDQDDVMDAASEFLKEKGSRAVLVGKVQDYIWEAGPQSAYSAYYVISAESVKYIDAYAIARKEAEAVEAAMREDVSASPASA